MENERNVPDVIMSFITAQGESTSRFCFLTIEEGGGQYQEQNLKSEQDFLKAFSKNSIESRERGWLPKNYKNRFTALGRPGIGICKVMAALHGVYDWRKYAEEQLYGRNEQNVRFFPISRRSIRDRNSETMQRIQSLLEMDIADYEKVCHEKRPAIFLKHPEIFNSNRFYIITAKCAEPQWRSVLENIFPQVVYRKEYLPIDKKKKFGFDVAWQGNRPVYLTFSLFKRGITDKLLKDFANLLKNVNEIYYS